MRAAEDVTRPEAGKIASKSAPQIWIGALGRSGSRAESRARASRSVGPFPPARQICPLPSSGLLPSPSFWCVCVCSGVRVGIRLRRLFGRICPDPSNGDEKRSAAATTRNKHTHTHREAQTQHRWIIDGSAGVCYCCRCRSFG